MLAAYLENTIFILNTCDFISLQFKLNQAISYF